MRIANLSNLDRPSRGGLSFVRWDTTFPVQNCSAANDFGPSKSAETLVSRQRSASAVRAASAKAGGTAWKSKPSWYIVAKNDRTIQPDCERFLAKRMGATTTEVASSHVVMLSQPQVVIDVIRKAVKATQGVTAAA